MFIGCCVRKINELDNKAFFQAENMYYAFGYSFYKSKKRN